MRNHSSIFSFPLPLLYLERRSVPKHNLHIFRVQRVFWSLGSFGDLPKEACKVWQMQSSVLRDPESQRGQGFVKSVSSRSLKSKVHGLNQAWRVFCYSCTLTLFSSGSITTWRATVRFFAEFFGFLFDNTSWCYLVVASPFSYSCALLLLFVVHVYALEQYRFIKHIYSCFRTLIN